MLSRIAQLVLVFVGVTLLIYLAVFALPGDPIRNLAGRQQLPPDTVAAIRAQYHLDDPFWQQFGRYLVGVLHGDFGTDFYGESVWDLMRQGWPVTLQLASLAWLFEIVLGVGAGVVSALRRGRLTDHTVLLLSVGVISIPAFVGAFALQLLLGVKAGIFPIAGDETGWPASYVLPAFALGAVGAASIARLTRSSMIRSLHADYVRTAIAKSLPWSRIVVRHALRNSLVPILTFVAIDLGYLIAGTVVVEGVFNLPGVGQLLFTSIRQQQGTVVVGVATALVMIFLLLNLAVDLLYGLLDPRIRVV
ncbi:ABC transporter permease [Jatrophihabitans endophyticus]|uniref:ABC transporter permease n=1 Tax=Jatrophihabitans endophyticus TaxID=1206085 RepID=UPI00190ED3CA|nr:ABC transporter permease [Jatrophihabitans endophyticus]